MNLKGGYGNRGGVVHVKAILLGSKKKTRERTGVFVLGLCGGHLIWNTALPLRAGLVPLIFPERQPQHCVFSIRDLYTSLAHVTGQSITIHGSVRWRQTASELADGFARRPVDVIYGFFLYSLFFRWPPKSYQGCLRALPAPCCFWLYWCWPARRPPPAALWWWARPAKDSTAKDSASLPATTEWLEVVVAVSLSSRPKDPRRQNLSGNLFIQYTDWAARLTFYYSNGCLQTFFFLLGLS